MFHRTTGALLAVAALVSLTLPGCGWLFGGEEGGVSEGDACVICVSGGKGPYHNNACQPKKLKCKKGLDCIDGINTCERRRTVGEACDYRPCEVELACDVEGICNAPGPEGTLCSRPEQCAGDLVCNFGGAESVDQGRCLPPEGGAGAPCAWMPMYGGGSDLIKGFTHEGCAPDLICLPDPRPDIEDPKILEGLSDCNLVSGCFYAGQCAPAASQGLGEACLEDMDCASGRCDRPKLPADKDGGAYRIPWPGLCSDVTDIGWSYPCGNYEYDPDAPACASGLRCVRGLCLALYGVDNHEPCAPVEDLAEGEALPPICFIGGECTVDEICRPAAD